MGETRAAFTGEHRRLMNDQAAPRRAMSTAVVERRQVRQAIAKVAVELEELQREAVFLNALTAHGRQGHQTDVTRLRRRAWDAEIKLDKAVAKLPEHLRNHGRIVDLRKAIASLEGNLRTE